MSGIVEAIGIAEEQYYANRPDLRGPNGRSPEPVGVGPRHLTDSDTAVELYVALLAARSSRNDGSKGGRENP